MAEMTAWQKHLNSHLELRESPHPMSKEDRKRMKKLAKEEEKSRKKRMKAAGGGATMEAYHPTDLRDAAAAILREGGCRV